MATFQEHASPVRVQRRRDFCGIFALSTLGACSGVWAQTATTSRPALERFIQTANFIPQCRLWANKNEKFVKIPKHPYSPLIVQIQRSNDSELLALLVQTFQGLTEDEANELVASLETPLGQWIVQTSLWSQKFDSSQKNEISGDSPTDLGNRPRRLSNSEIRTIKTLGGTPHWQALRRVGNASLLGDELVMVFDFPQFVDLLLDPSQP